MGYAWGMHWVGIGYALGVHWVCIALVVLLPAGGYAPIHTHVYNPHPYILYPHTLHTIPTHSANRRWDDASVSPVIRQTLLHWAFELTEAEFEAMLGQL